MKSELKSDYGKFLKNGLNGRYIKITKETADRNKDIELIDFDNEIKNDEELRKTHEKIRENKRNEREKYYELFCDSDENESESSMTISIESRKFAKGNLVQYYYTDENNKYASGWTPVVIDGVNLKDGLYVYDFKWAKSPLEYNYKNNTFRTVKYGRSHGFEKQEERLFKEGQDMTNLLDKINKDIANPEFKHSNKEKLKAFIKNKNAFVLNFLQYFLLCIKNE